MKGNISVIAEEAYRLGKLTGYEEGAKHWKKEGAAAERAALVADDAAIERVVKADFMAYGVYGGYMQQARESEWQRMRNIELHTFKRRLLALLDVASGPDRPASEALIEEVDVTPEMIDAARSVFDRYYIGGGAYILSDECIKEVCRALAQATTQPQPREEPHA